MLFLLCLCFLFLQQTVSQVYVTYTYYLSINCTGAPLFFIGEHFVVGNGSLCTPVACTSSSGNLIGSSGAYSVNCVTGLPSLPSGMIGYQNWAGNANCHGNPFIYGALPGQCTNVTSQQYTDALIVRCAGTSVVLDDFYNTQLCTGLPISNTLSASCTLVGGGSYIALGCSASTTPPTPEVYQTSKYYNSANCSGSAVIFTASPVSACVTYGCMSTDLIGTTAGLVIGCVSGVPSLPSNMIGVNRCGNCTSGGTIGNIAASCTTNGDGSFIQLGCGATSIGASLHFGHCNMFVLLVILLLTFK